MTRASHLVHSAAPGTERLILTPNTWLTPDEIAEAVTRGSPDSMTVTLRSMIVNAQVFDFGPVPDELIRTESVRAGPLLGRGMLDIPFDCVLYRYRFRPDMEITQRFREAVPREYWDDFRSSMDTEQRFTTLILRRGKQFWTVADFVQLTAPMRAVLDLDLRGGLHAWEPVAAADIEAFIDDRGEAAFRSGKSWSPANTVNTPDAQRAMAAGLADTLAALSLILAARNVPQRVDPAPAKLNAKRARQGRAPLPRVTHVNAGLYVTARSNTDRGGTHASPVPHLRRGHMRHLASGRLTWVRDCIVNARSAAEAERRERYEVDIDPSSTDRV
jgi:hypothetical protein